MKSVVIAIVCAICCGCAVDSKRDRSQACCGDRMDAYGGDRNAQASINIKSARYGNNGNWVDVTERCRALVNHGKLILPQDLHTTLDVDPNPGYMKYVEMIVVVNGAEIRMTVADNLQLTPLQMTTGKASVLR